ncbi:MAG: PAS domain S-box protein, partial [Thermomicrobiales bacterium]
LFIIIAPNGTRQYISPSCERLLGFTQEELIGDSGFSLTHPDDQHILSEAMRECLRTGAPTPLLELRIREKGGGYRHFEAIGINLVNEPSVHGVVFTSRDVTERHRAEASQRFVAAVVDAAEDAIITRTPEGTVLSWNASAERVYGYTAEEMIGQNISRVIPPELRPLVTSIDHRLARGERIPPGESQRIRKDGTVIDISYSLAPIFDRDGKPNAAVAIVRDITEKKRIEAALRASETRLRGFMDASLDCVVGMDHLGIITDFNPAAERTFQVAREEAVGRRLSEVLMPPHLGHLHDAGVDHYLVTGHGPALNRRIETIGLRASGESFPLELTAIPYEVDGLPWFAGYLRDITDRVEMEGALRESEERARGAFVNGPIGMALVQLDGTVLQANRALHDLLGYGPDALEGRAWPGMVAPADRDDVKSDFASLIGGDAGATEKDCRFLRADGAIVWVHQAVSMVDDRHGDPSLFVCQLVDLTEARESDRLKNEFVATVSHELRTPLTAITGFVDLLLDGAAGDLNPTAERFLTVAQGNGRRLGNLINDLLDMSKIEAGKVELRLLPTDIAAAAEQASHGVSPQINAK